MSRIIHIQLRSSGSKAAHIHILIHGMHALVVANLYSLGLSDPHEVRVEEIHINEIGRHRSLVRVFHCQILNVVLGEFQVLGSIADEKVDEDWDIENTPLCCV